MRQLTALAVAGLALGLATLGRAQEEARLLRYQWRTGEKNSWAITLHSTGNLAIAQGQAPAEAFPLNQTTNLTLFTEVLGVGEDGAARQKVSLGLISSDTVLPGGQTVHFEFDPATGSVRAPGLQLPQPLLPEALRQMLAEGFVVTVTPRGEVTQVEGLEAIRALLAGMAGGPSALIDPSALVHWIGPPLPEKAVKPGDSWQQAVPWVLGAAQGPALPVTYRYVGPAEVDGLSCLKLEISAQTSGLQLSLPAPAAGPGLAQDINNLSLRVFLTAYLRADNLSLARCQGEVILSGTVHQTGTVKLGEQEQHFDHTVQLDNVCTAVEITAQP